MLGDSNHFPARFLVVVELKRTESGEHMDLQAIRYAAMVANISDEKLIEAHDRYISKRRQEENYTVEEGYEGIKSHLQNIGGGKESVDTQQPRIILASPGFSKELTTTVLWLRDCRLDISCVKLQLFTYDGVRLLDARQIIPLPEAEEYQTKFRNKQAEVIQANQVTTTSGADVFRSGMEGLSDSTREKLNCLCSWALTLEGRNLLSLVTRSGKDNILRLLSLPTQGNSAALVTVSYTNGLSLWRDNFTNLAPEARAKILSMDDQCFIHSATVRRNPSTSLLDAIAEAYREADGQPTTTPPGTAPDSPGRADC